MPFCELIDRKGWKRSQIMDIAMIGLEKMGGNMVRWRACRDERAAR